jgi:hypothetical protein
MLASFGAWCSLQCLSTTLYSLSSHEPLAGILLYPQLWATLPTVEEADASHNNRRFGRFT